MKDKVIVYGAGKLFRKNKIAIENKFELYAIIDKKAYKDDDRVCIYPPKMLNELPKLPILIMSDFIFEITEDIISIIGDEVFDRKLLIGRLCFPCSDEEEYIASFGNEIRIKEGKIVFSINSEVSYVINDSKSYIKRLYAFTTRYKDPILKNIIEMSPNPIDRMFGTRRGIPVDRVYIDKFLDVNRYCICGDCLEIAENTYTLKYGDDRVSSAQILHVEGWGENVIKGNLESGEGLVDNQYDTMIITQTLMFIYDLEKTAQNIFNTLKKGGTALITVSGISKIAKFDDDNWGMFHSFYYKGIKKIFDPVFGEENVKVTHYGNVKTAMAFLYGATAEEVNEEDFYYYDYEYPVIYGIKLIKV